MENRSEIRRRLLRARKAAKTHMDAICGTSPLTYPLLKQELRQFILAKFLLDEEAIPEDASFDALVEKSLSHSMKIDPSLVAEFDTAKSCDGAGTSGETTAYSPARSYASRTGPEYGKCRTAGG